MEIVKETLKMFGTVFSPAWIFWELYQNYEPEKLLWWCGVSFGAVLLLLGSIGLEKMFDGPVQQDEQLQDRNYIE